MAMTTQTAKTPVPGAPDPSEARRVQYLALKADVHRRLLARLNLETLASAERARAETEIRSLAALLISEAGIPLTLNEREAIIGDVLDEVFGFGPLEPLLRDPTVNDILVNTYARSTWSGRASSSACRPHSRTTSICSA